VHPWPSRSRPAEELAASTVGAGGGLASLFEDAHLDGSTPPARPVAGRPAAGDRVPPAASRFADVADSPEANMAARAAEQSALEVDDYYEADGPQRLDFYTNDGEEYEGDMDEFGVTQGTSFGRVWALKDANYVTITEPGDAYAFVDEDVVANDEDEGGGGGSESLLAHKATRRGTQPSRGASAASAWLVAMGGSDALEAGSKGAARAAYERSTQANAVDIYRWSHKHGDPPTGLDDLFPDYAPAVLPTLARLTLDVQDLPLDDMAGQGATTHISDPQAAEDQSEYLSYYQEIYKYEGDDEEEEAGSVGAVGTDCERAVVEAADAAIGSEDGGVGGGALLDVAEEEAQLEALEAATQQRLEDAGVTVGKRTPRAGASAANYHDHDLPLRVPLQGGGRRGRLPSLRPGQY